MTKKRYGLSPITLAARTYYRKHGTTRTVADCTNHLMSLGHRLGPAHRAAVAAQVRISRESKRYRTSVSFESLELYQRIRRLGRGDASRAINKWAKSLGG